MSSYIDTGVLQSSGGMAASVINSSAPVSIEQYVEKIPLSKRNIVVGTGVEIDEIAEKIKCWESIAPFLGLSDPQVHEIKKDHSNYGEQKLVVRPL